MKQFLNVLYRRILYKIPLKFLLILLAVFAVCIASVKASDIYVETEIIVPDSGRIEFDSSEGYSVLCVNNYNCPSGFCIRTNDGGGNNCENLSNISTAGNSLGLCITHSSFSFHRPNSTCSIMVSKLYNTDYTSLQCQTEYNLIPISSVDSSYCQSNNLCPSNNCPVGSGGVSSLYINDILHVGSPFIYMTIPQEIGWDYEYTQGGTNMLIDVEGYNVDYDKIEGIVNTQSYTPDEYDLNSIITNVIPLFVPGLVIILFIYFVFRLIKKIF